MPDESLLREKAREGLRAGKLPVRGPDRTSGGPGCGVACGVCGDPITRSQPEIEAEVARNDMPPETYHFHTRCFAAWEFERTKIKGASSEVD
jgi:hypothetical protein